MSLFVDLRHLKSSVTNLSDVVDKMSTSIGQDQPENPPKRYEGRGIFSSTAFKPSVGLGVRFSQSQEDVYRNMPSSSRLKSHLSLPNLGKEESVFDRAGFSDTDRKPKIVEIEEDKCSAPLVSVSADNIGDWIAASSRRRPSFDDSGDRHPMDFLEDLSSYMCELNVSQDRRLSLALSCLEGVPLMWARCFRKDLASYEDFEKAFREEFWGDERQRTVLYDLKLGKYESCRGRVGMAEYFLHKVSSYRHLDPPPSDLEIVYSLAAHYPPAVELEMRLSQRPSLRDAYRLLRRRDGQAADFVPNYLFEMCESYQRAHKPDSARRPASASAGAGPGLHTTAQTPPPDHRL